MNYKIHKTCVKIIRQGDPKFNIIDGAVVTPRAGFEISVGTPNTYKEVILECLRRGWLKPVAHVRDNELMWDILSE